jgi:hypothetical protein
MASIRDGAIFTEGSVRWARERHSQARLTTTCVSPEKPSSRAAAGVTSIIRPRTKGSKEEVFSMCDYSLKPLTHHDALEFSDGQIVPSHR